MYVTRPLSLYRKRPEVAAEDPPEGPNSGYLVVLDEESEAEATCCYGLCNDESLGELPFPQNTTLKVSYTITSDSSTTTTIDKVIFIPVPGHPLSSRRYYVIKAEGKHKGLACACSREDDKITCCFCRVVKDVEPRPFNHMDMYQQMEIICRFRGSFTAKSTAPDGYPPDFLRRKGWNVYAKMPSMYPLGESHGIDTSLRTRLPTFDFAIGSKHSSIIQVGKWCCPFMFIKEMSSFEDQMNKTMFYEMHLEQCWEEIYQCANHGNEGDVVVVDVSVRKESATLSQDEQVQEDAVVENGMMWFRPHNRVGEWGGVGLSLAIVERMRWEAARGGWVDGDEKNVKVEKEEVFEGGGWKKFGCYMLVERFILRRMDGSLVLSYAFRHTNKIQSKWE